MSQLVALLDRIHVVNEEIATVNSTLSLHCLRYFPRLEHIGSLPMICPLPPSGNYNNESYGSDTLHSIWSVELSLAVDNFFAGSDTSAAQSNAEACIDHIVSEYWKRPRLELETATATQGAGAYDPILGDVRVTQNSEVQMINESIALVTFTLICETTDEIERI